MNHTDNNGGPDMVEEGPVRHQISVVDEGVYDTPAAIAAFRLETIIRYADGRARGIHMTDPRKARGVQLARLRADYGIDARRWSQAAAELRGILADWRELGVPDHFCVRR